MPYDEKLAQRIRTLFKEKKGVTEIKMFGGLCFMLYGNMTCGIDREKLIVRVGPQQYKEALNSKHAHPFDFTGRPLKGLVYVSKEGSKTARLLNKWVEMGMKFTESLPKKI